MSIGGQASHSFLDRVVGVGRLNRPTYEEVEHDQSATVQAGIVVVVAAIATAIGASSQGADGIFSGLIGALLGWVVGAAFIYFVGTRVIPSLQVQADIGQVLRTVGFANVPSFLLILGFIPIVNIVVALVVFVWGIATLIIAIQSALEASVSRAVGIAVIAVVLQFVVSIIIAAIFGVSIAALT